MGFLKLQLPEKNGQAGACKKRVPKPELGNQPKDSAGVRRFQQPSARSQAPLGNAVFEALLPLPQTGEAELPVPDSQAELGNQPKAYLRFQQP